MHTNYYFTKQGLILIEPVDAAHADLNRLIAALDDFQIGLYGAENCVVEDGLALAKRGAVFYAGTNDAGEMVGIGALIPFDRYAEIKRVFVAEQYRGIGIGGQILTSLEEYAQSLNIGTICLESGVLQPSAQRLYEKSGYKVIDSFGKYKANPLSVFFRKQINP